MFFLAIEKSGGLTRWDMHYSKRKIVCLPHLKQHGEKSTPYGGIIYYTNNDEDTLTSVNVIHRAPGTTKAEATGYRGSGTAESHLHGANLRHMEIPEGDVLSKTGTNNGYRNTSDFKIAGVHYTYDFPTPSAPACPSERI